MAHGVNAPALPGQEVCHIHAGGRAHCGLCGLAGHNRNNCPQLPADVRNQSPAPKALRQSPRTSPLRKKQRDVTSVVVDGNGNLNLSCLSASPQASVVLPPFPTQAQDANARVLYSPTSPADSNDEEQHVGNSRDVLAAASSSTVDPLQVLFSELELNPETRMDQDAGIPLGELRRCDDAGTAPSQSQPKVRPCSVAANEMRRQLMAAPPPHLATTKWPLRL